MRSLDIKELKVFPSDGGEVAIIAFPGRAPQFGTKSGGGQYFRNLNAHIMADAESEPRGTDLRLVYSALAELCGFAPVLGVDPEEEPKVNKIKRDAVGTVAGAIGAGSTVIIASNWEVDGHGTAPAARKQPGSSEAIVAAGYPEYQQVAKELTEYNGADTDTWMRRYTTHLLMQMRLIAGAAAGYSLEDMMRPAFAESEALPPAVAA